MPLLVFFSRLNTPTPGGGSRCWKGGGTACRLPCLSSYHLANVLLMESHGRKSRLCVFQGIGTSRDGRYHEGGCLKQTPSVSRGHLIVGFMYNVLKRHGSSVLSMYMHYSAPCNLYIFSHLESEVETFKSDFSLCTIQIYCKDFQ